MINYEWQIAAKPTSQYVSGYKDFIIAVVWIYKGTRDTDNISYSIPCTTFFVPKSQSEFIPFDEVTDEVAISWLEAKEDTEALKLEIEQKIEEKTVIEIIPEPTSPEIPEIPEI
jgi:hypothetical protein